MSIYVSTACLAGTQPLCARLESYARAGLRYAEFGAGVHLEDDDLHQAIDSWHGRALIHNYFPPPPEGFVLNLASPSPEIRERGFALVDRALELTERLEAPFYSLHAGFVTDPVGFNDGRFRFSDPPGREEAGCAHQRFVTSLERVLAQRAGSAPDILIENNVCAPDAKGALLLQEAEEFSLLFRDLPVPSLGVLLDTGHLNVSAHTLGFDRLTFIDQLAERIRAVHLHDNNGLADLHRPVGPDSWTLDVLRRPEFASVPIIVEARFQNVTALRSHVIWLAEQLDREGEIAPGFPRGGEEA